MTPEETRARIEGGASYSTWGSALHHRRYIQPYKHRPGGQRRCHCGCSRSITHLGMANGVCLTSGCEWYVRRWVRDPHA